MKLPLGTKSKCVYENGVIIIFDPSKELKTVLGCKNNMDKRHSQQKKMQVEQK